MQGKPIDEQAYTPPSMALKDVLFAMESRAGTAFLAYDGELYNAVVHYLRELKMSPSDRQIEQIIEERDAAEDAMQWLDCQLGGDGEYYFNTAEPNDCPCDPPSMARMIAERVTARLEAYEAALKYIWDRCGPHDHIPPCLDAAECARKALESK